MGPPPGLPLPHKRRKTSHSGASAEGSASGDLPAEAVSTRAEQAAQPSDRLRSLRTSARTDQSGRSVAESIIALTPTSSPPVRRIKLIVKPPQPTLSSPAQKPPPPMYGGSMTAYLSSYSAPEGIDLDNVGLRELYRDELTIWRKYDSLRRQGRMLYRPPDELPSHEELLELETRRQPDVWDVIIDAVKARAREPLPDGRVVAAQIAGQVQVYLASKKQRDSKVKTQEDKRLRLLAKATGRTVMAEWKKAVAVR